MSLKKDNYKSSDKKIMNFAISLAENNKYLTGTNPSVGCVIVKNNKILSFATTNNGGRPHAESIALNKNRNNKGNNNFRTAWNRQDNNSLKFSRRVHSRWCKTKANRILFIYEKGCKRSG